MELADRQGVWQGGEGRVKENCSCQCHQVTETPHVNSQHLPLPAQWFEIGPREKRCPSALGALPTGACGDGQTTECSVLRSLTAQGPHLGNQRSLLGGDI